MKDRLERAIDRATHPIWRNILINKLIKEYLS
jgi:hypothetical protein